MELNKRKSLLTPAAPTVWGMIHGDIEKQQDIVEMIVEKVKEAVGVDVVNSIKAEVLAEINPLLVENYQPIMVSGYNIKTLKGRDLLGEGDIDPLDNTDRTLLQTVEEKADKVDTYTKRQVDKLLENVEVDTTNLATKEELENLRDYEVQTALMASDTAKNLASSANRQVGELRTYVDEQLGAIDTMTEDILA
jgi:hypothetical protein